MSMTCGKPEPHAGHRYDKAYVGSGTDGDPWRVSSWQECIGVPKSTGNRRTYVTIEVEMGCDDEWNEVGLESPPENAEQLLAQIKAEAKNDIKKFIQDWALADAVSVKVEVMHIEDGQRAVTTARWHTP